MDPTVWTPGMYQDTGGRGRLFTKLRSTSMGHARGAALAPTPRQATAQLASLALAHVSWSRASLGEEAPLAVRALLHLGEQPVALGAERGDLGRELLDDLREGLRQLLLHVRPLVLLGLAAVARRSARRSARVQGGRSAPRSARGHGREGAGRGGVGLGGGTAHSSVSSCRMTSSRLPPRCPRLSTRFSCAIRSAFSRRYFASSCACPSCSRAAASSSRRLAFSSSSLARFSSSAHLASMAPSRAAAAARLASALMGTYPLPAPPVPLTTVM